MSQPRNGEHLAALPVDAATPLPPLPPPPRQAISRETLRRIDAWCAANLAHWEPERRAAFRRALIKNPDTRAAVLG